MAVSEGNAVLPRKGGPKTVLFEEKVELVGRDDEATKLEDRWYTSNEYFFMRRKATNMAKRMEEMDNGEDCSRGLEIVESNSAQERNEKIQNLVKAVIETQKQDSDPEKIAAISRKASHDSIQESLKRAKDDAKHARHILADIRKEWSGREKKFTTWLKNLFRTKKK